MNYFTHGAPYSARTHQSSLCTKSTRQTLTLITKRTRFFASRLMVFSITARVSLYTEARAALLFVLYTQHNQDFCYKYSSSYP